MSPQNQRVAIATACGWTRGHTGEKQWVNDPHGIRRGWASMRGVADGALPDYLNDLNAMHEAEEVLMEKGVNAWWSYVAFINRHNSRQFGTETAVHATAAEKCEAFLRTLGLLEEEAQ